MKQEGFAEDLLKRTKEATNSGQISTKSDRYKKLINLKNFLEKSVQK